MSIILLDRLVAQADSMRWNVGMKAREIYSAADEI